MSRIPTVSTSGPKNQSQQENKLLPAAKKTSGSNLRNFKRPSDDHLHLIQKRQKTESGVRNKVLSTLQQSDISSKQAAYKKVALQPLPDNGLVRSSMPAAVSTAKIGKKPKRPAWDLKGRIQDMEENFLATQERNASLKHELEEYNQRIAALESANSVLHHDNEIKSVQSEEALSQINELKHQRKKEQEESEATIKEKIKEIEKLQSVLSLLKQELSIAKMASDNMENTITNLTCVKSSIETQLESTKAMLKCCEEKKSQLTKMCLDKDSEILSLKQRNEEKESKIRELESLRRKLHNTVQELKGNIRVFCRMRPALPEEIKDGMNMANIVAVSERSIEIQQLPDVGLNESGSKMQPKYEFSFDAYFPPSTSQETIFYEISQLVQSVLDGYNVCIFAYGQTGSGKTFTMEGPASIVDFVADKDHPNLGMMPRSVEQIFTTIADLELKGWKYKCEALFLEIYNERIRDLLNYQSGNTKCDIVKSGIKGTDCKISNVTISEVTSCEQVFDLMKKARMNRVVAATKCSEYSSRSHYVFQMKIFGENSITGEKCDGTLNLVDLAGSERVKESQSVGDRLSEAKAINKSLSNLGKVIMSLSRKENHIPYRDSKLTHLLANSLGGNSKTLMFVNISPDNKNLYETVNSLRFATQVNQCNIGTAVRKIK